MNWKKLIDHSIENVNIILLAQLYEIVRKEAKQSAFYSYINALCDNNIICKERLFKASQAMYIRKVGHKKLTNRKKYLEILIHEYEIRHKNYVCNSILSINQLDIPTIYIRLVNQFPYIKNNAFLRRDYQYIKECITYRKACLTNTKGIPPQNINHNINLMNLYNRGIYVVSYNKDTLMFCIFDCYNRMNRGKLKKDVEAIFELTKNYGFACKIKIEVCVWNESMQKKTEKHLKSLYEVKENTNIFMDKSFIYDNEIFVTNLDVQRYFGNLYIYL
ncbi:MAG: hypothetical protein EOM50_06190 [Erysipelotrichia bacterium]|nr:hypothetical protein [Erysipelotrichia bacterium]